MRNGSEGAEEGIGASIRRMVYPQWGGYRDRTPGVTDAAERDSPLLGALLESMFRSKMPAGSVPEISYRSHQGRAGVSQASATARGPFWECHSFSIGRQDLNVSNINESKCAFNFGMCLMERGNGQEVRYKAMFALGAAVLGLGPTGGPCREGLESRG